MIEPSIIFHSIGILHSPFKTIEDMPIQPSGASGVRGKLILAPEYSKGLQDLSGFSHIYLIYHFHKINEHQLLVTPFLDRAPHGIFATRAPKRPNPIGMSIVRLISIESNVIILENVDILDGTPVLDIKPYVPAFDHYSNVRIGWLANSGDNVSTIRSDQRFSGKQS